MEIVSFPDKCNRTSGRCNHDHINLFLLTDTIGWLAVIHQWSCPDPSTWVAKPDIYLYNPPPLRQITPIASPLFGARPLVLLAQILHSMFTLGLFCDSISACDPRAWSIGPNKPGSLTQCCSCGEREKARVCVGGALCFVATRGWFIFS